jgi:hypothetical protein
LLAAAKVKNNDTLEISGMNLRAKIDSMIKVAEIENRAE